MLASLACLSGFLGNFNLTIYNIRYECRTEAPTENNSAT